MLGSCDGAPILMRFRTHKKMTPQWSRWCAKKKTEQSLSLTHGCVASDPLLRLMRVCSPSLGIDDTIVVFAARLHLLLHFAPFQQASAVAVYWITQLFHYHSVCHAGR